MTEYIRACCWGHQPGVNSRKIIATAVKYCLEGEREEIQKMLLKDTKIGLEEAIMAKMAGDKKSAQYGATTD